MGVMSTSVRAPYGLAHRLSIGQMCTINICSEQTTWLFAKEHRLVVNYDWTVSCVDGSVSILKVSTLCGCNDFMKGSYRYS